MPEKEAWERLAASRDYTGDLMALFDHEFLVAFSRHFNREPHPYDLLVGAIETARTYVGAKWLKRADSGKLLKYSGVHLIEAGLAARHLSKELGQVKKSALAAAVIQRRLERHLEESDGSKSVLSSSLHHRVGPAARFDEISELAALLEEAIGTFVELPSEERGEVYSKTEALEFAASTNTAPRRRLRKNHAVEAAAKAFRPLWEAHSSERYARSSYRHDQGGYVCPPADALHMIISRLDSTVALSLVGTAISQIDSNS